MIWPLLFFKYEGNFIEGSEKVLYAMRGSEKEGFLERRKPKAGGLESFVILPQNQLGKLLCYQIISFQGNGLLCSVLFRNVQNIQGRPLAT